MATSGRPGAKWDAKGLENLLRDLDGGESFRDVAGYHGVRPSLVSALAIVSGRGVSRLHGMSSNEVATRRSAARLVGEKLRRPEPGLLGLDLAKSGLWELGQAWVMLRDARGKRGRGS